MPAQGLTQGLTCSSNPLALAEYGVSNGTLIEAQTNHTSATTAGYHH